MFCTKHCVQDVSPSLFLLHKNFFRTHLLHRSSSILFLLNNIIKNFLIIIHTSVDEELRKDAKVQEERSQTTQQPTQVNQNVSAVDCTSFSRSALLAMLAMVTDRVEGENAKHICQVTNASKQEEQGIEAFSALAAVVEQKLRNTAAEVKRSAQVPEYLAHNVEVQVVILLLFGFVAVG